MKKLLIAAGTAITISAFIAPATAHDSSSPVARVVKPGIIHGRGSIIQYGSSGAALVAGFNNVDTPQTWNCKYSAGCTITVSAMIQLQNGGDWAICAVVDGNYINPPCPYQGNLPDPGTNGFVTGNSQQNWLVSQGSHTVQTQIYVSSATTLGNWETHQHIAEGQ
jgi:hypothetical protein